MSGLPLGEGKVIKMEKLKIGDIICVNGISCEIAEIINQEPYEWRNAYYIEFRDTNGIYRNWKQNYDGGFVIKK